MHMLELCYISIHIIYDVYDNIHNIYYNLSQIILIYCQPLP